MEKALCGKIPAEQYFAVLVNASLRAPVPCQLVLLSVFSHSSETVDDIFQHKKENLTHLSFK